MGPYVLTKHAIVGLSGSLRIEAAEHGVQVSVLCPTAIETPLLDAPMDDGEGLWRPDVRSYLTKVGGAPYPVDRFVANALRAIERGKGVIIEPFGARARIALQRFLPGLVERIGRKAFREALAEKR
jgi:short-subunit dehydrogenase